MQMTVVREPKAIATNLDTCPHELRHQGRKHLGVMVVAIQHRDLRIVQQEVEKQILLCPEYLPGQ